MVRLKFPITHFSLCSQLNPASKTLSLTLLMFFKFDFTLSLTEVDNWQSYFSQICYGCGGGRGPDGASSGGGGRVRLGS
ncbi:hypothetical protein GBA52_026137 [Prunus armeniaca]|nr:hypothetical protein GBA52_026137 [Prunus armeniaca]